MLLSNATNFSLAACDIKNNLAYTGGGVYLYNSMVYMKSCIISQNFASLGGGVGLNWHGRVIFDQIMRSSVYDNIAGHGQDILASNTMVDLEIFLDMGTVNHHNSYYISYTKSVLSDPGTLLNIDILRGYLTEVNADIYVSPAGDDSNNGISSATPLKSIYRAMQIVQSDSLNPKTVYLAPGNYSSEEGQFFPIGLKSYVKLQGAGIGLTNLTNSRYSKTIRAQRVNNIAIDGLSLNNRNNPIVGSPITYSRIVDGRISNIIVNGIPSSMRGGIYLGSNSDYYSNCYLDNVTISGNNAVRQSGLFSLVVDLDIDRLTIDNCSVTGGELDSPNSLFYFSGNKLKMSNSKIVNSSVSYNDINIVSIGINGDQATRELKLDNVLVANNQTGGGNPVFIANFSDNPGIINNCTFVNNSGADYAVRLNGNFEVNNCIFNNNTSGEIKSAGSTSQLQFNNNFIRNYPASTSVEAFNNVHFNDVVLTGDPGFCSSIADDPLSYQLGNSSICRDMGTPDTTGLVLPDTDLAGNPRIYGTAIDIGCYEWNYPVSVEDELAPPAIQLKTFPNPFSDQLTLLFNLKQRGRLNCEFYNVKGQKVRSLADAPYNSGDHMLIWDGRDNSGQRLGSGIYFMKLQLDGKAIATRKMILTK